MEQRMMDFPNKARAEPDRTVRRRSLSFRASPTFGCDLRSPCLHRS